MPILINDSHLIHILPGGARHGHELPVHGGPVGRHGEVQHGATDLSAIPITHQLILRITADEVFHRDGVEVELVTTGGLQDGRRGRVVALHDERLVLRVIRQDGVDLLIGDNQPGVSVRVANDIAHAQRPTVNGKVLAWQQVLANTAVVRQGHRIKGLVGRGRQQSVISGQPIDQALSFDGAGMALQGPVTTQRGDAGVVGGGRHIRLCETCQAFYKDCALFIRSGSTAINQNVARLAEDLANSCQFSAVTVEVTVTQCQAAQLQTPAAAMTQNVKRVKLAIDLRPQRDLLQTVLAGIDQHNGHSGPRAIDQSLVTRHRGVNKHDLPASRVLSRIDLAQHHRRGNQRIVVPSKRRCQLRQPRWIRREMHKLCRWRQAVQQASRILDSAVGQKAFRLVGIVHGVRVFQKMGKVQSTGAA